MKWVLYLATVLSFIAYNCWKTILETTGFQVFDIMVAFYLSLICLYIFKKEKGSFIKFFLFELSVFNIVKELFLDPGKLELREALLIIILPSIWYFKEKNKTW